MGVTLRATREDEFERWLPGMRDGYAKDMVVNGGASEDQARAKAIKDVEQLFPGDVARNLYRSLGYVENAVFMSKPV